MTNLQEAYLKAAQVFVKTVVQGNPDDIMKKLEKCPILRNVSLSDDGQAIFFEIHGEVSRINFPIGVKLIKRTKYEVVSS